MKCIFLGLTTVDIIHYLDEFPSGNQKVRANNQLIFAGGPAVNAAVTCASLGTETVLITALGNQPLAELARQDLSRHGVQLIDNIERMGDTPVVSSVIVDESSGDRCVVSANNDLGRSLVDEDYASLLMGADVLMVDGYYPEAALACVQAAKSLELKTVLDAGSWKEGLQEILPYIDYAICSDDYCPPGCTTPESVAAYLQDIGIPNIAITAGGAPIRLWQQDYLELQVAETEVVDTLGAGDILHGAFCHYHRQGDFGQALKYAARIATISCQYRGTRQWITEYRNQL